MNLDKKVFLTGLVYLKNVYPDFNFDLENTKVMDVWYGFFSSLDDSQFNIMITAYCENEIYPPQSPAHLLKAYKNKVSESIDNKNLTAEQAFETFRTYNRKYGGLNYCRDRVIGALKRDYPIVAIVVEEMENELAVWETNDTYLPKRFKDNYMYYLNQAKKENPLLKIGTSENRINELLGNVKLLEGKKNGC